MLFSLVSLLIISVSLLNSIFISSVKESRKEKGSFRKLLLVVFFIRPWRKTLLSLVIKAKS